VVLAGAVALQALILGVVGLSAAGGVFAAATVAPIAMVSSAAVMAFGFVALYGQFMNWSDPRQGGVDFTLFQCMDAAVSMVSGMVAGVIAEHLGYGFFFGVACAVSLAALPLIWRVSGQRAPQQGVAHV